MSQGLPGTPNEGTGLDVPLLSSAQYRTLTGDTTSTDDEITAALDDALFQFCQETVRTLAYGQYSEVLYLYQMGMVYPSATPLDPTKPVTSGAEDDQEIYDPADADNPSSVIQGAGIWVGFFTPLPWMPIWSSVIPPQTVVTYWGGYQPYQSNEGPTPGLHPKIARALATIAYYMRNPSVVKTMGATSVSMGGVSIAGDLSSFMQYDKNLRRLVKRLTRPQAHAWQN